MKSRLIPLIALVTATAGCKKAQPSAPSAPVVPDAPAASVPVPATPSAAPAPVKKDPLAAVPRTDSTLSLFEPQGGKCQWLRVDPVAGNRATVASFEGDCKGASVAWNADQSRAFVWFDPERVQSSGYHSESASGPGYPDEEPTPDATPRMYEVTVSSGEVRTVPLPAVEGELASIGYKGADLIALSLKSLSSEEVQEPLTVEGQVIAFDELLEGVPALASAHRLDKEDSWKRIEVKGTSIGSDVSLGVNELEAAFGHAPRSSELLVSNLRDPGPPLTEEQLSKLLSLVPPPLVEKALAEGMPEEGGWSQGLTPAGPFFVWEVTGDTEHTTGHLIFEREGRLQPLKDLGFTDGDLVSVSSQGPFLLVSAERVGTHPRLYDLRTGKLAFRSDTARVATFWPIP